MITGQKKIKINRKVYYLRFTWAALAEISTKFGDNPNLFQAETVAFVGSAGMRVKHPEMTAEKIMEISPPLIPFANDVQEALTWAYFGDQGVPKDEGGVKKKRTLTGLLNHIGRLFSRVFRR